MLTFIWDTLCTFAAVLSGTVPPSPETIAARSLQGGLGALSTHDMSWFYEEADEPKAETFGHMGAPTRLETFMPSGFPN